MTAAAVPVDARKVSPVKCKPDPKFPGSFDIPEASAATEVELRPGQRELLVVSDSGHRGHAMALYGVLKNGATISDQHVNSGGTHSDPSAELRLDGIAKRGRRA